MMKAPLDSRQLLAFSILARTGSFTQAAREIFLTQSAVSHAMKGLENEVGCRLFDRVGKKVTLTQAGEQLLHHAELILNEMIAARAGLDELRKWGHGRLRLVAPTTLCTSLLPRVLSEFKEEFPRSQIRVEPGDSHECAMLLEQNRADLALAMELKSDERFEFLPIFSDELVFVVAPTHPWARAGRAIREDVPAQQLIVYGKTSMTWRLIDSYIRSEGIQLNTVMELRSMEAIRELAKLDLGVAILAPWVVERELAEGSLVALPLGRKRLSRQWGVLHFRGRRLNLAEETFVSLTRTAAQSLRQTLSGRT